MAVLLDRQCEEGLLPRWRGFISESRRVKKSRRKGHSLPGGMCRRLEDREGNVWKQGRVLEFRRKRKYRIISTGYCRLAFHYKPLCRD